MHLSKVWAKIFTAIFRILLFLANMPHIGHFQPFQMWTCIHRWIRNFTLNNYLKKKHGLKMNILASISRFWSFLTPKWPKMTKSDENAHCEAHTVSKYGHIIYRWIGEFIVNHYFSPKMVYKRMVKRFRANLGQF